MSAMMHPQQTPAKAPAPPIPVMPSAPGQATGQATGQGTSQDAPPAVDAVISDAQAPRPIEGLSTTTGFPQVDPAQIIRETIPIVGMSLAMVVSIFVGWPLARAFARRMDRRTELGTVDARQLLPQIRQLQESLDTMAVELERIGEAQRYQAKLLTERSSTDTSHRS